MIGLADTCSVSLRRGLTALYLESLIDLAGETVVLAAGGLFIGMVFGVLAQLSRFCLRSAVIEFSQSLLGSKVAIWLLTFSAALAATAGCHRVRAARRYWSPSACRAR